MNSLVNVACASILPCRAPVPQSVATRAVNPGVVNLNQAKPTFFQTFDKNHCDNRQSSSTNGLSVCVDSSKLLGKTAVCSTGVR